MNPSVKKPSGIEKQEAETWPVWEKEKSTFPWQYDEKETCLILEGKATVKCPEGTIEFSSGDYVTFPEGLSCTWEIQQKIRKHYKFG